MSRSNDTSLSLLERAQQEDPEAWGRIVQLYGPMVLHWCRRAGLKEHDAQDVCQETFSTVARSLPSFRRDRQGDSFRGWLRTIASSKLSDFGRKQAKAPFAIGGSDHLNRVESLPAANEGGGEGVAAEAVGEPCDEALELSQEAEICRRTLDFIRSDFEERTWRAFWRTAIDGQNASDVSQELGISPAAVRKAKSRILARLRTELDGLIQLD
jgi:RNA polymerase sigma-70 factor (ECF subfamily)